MELCKEISTGDGMINFKAADTYLVSVLTFFACCRSSGFH